jgi:hypothetical protein
MITPAFGLTATERVLPKLALDFTTAILDPRVTIARALNTATRVNSSGFIEIVNADLPRFDYDPVTQKINGLLIEELRSNLILNSKSLSDWSINFSAVRTLNATTSPDGTVNASQLDMTSNPGSGMYVFRPVTNTTAHTASVFVKAVSGTPIIKFGCDASPTNANITFNTVTGVITSTGVNATSSSRTSFGNGWYRITVSYVTTGTSSGIIVYNATGSTASVYLYGAQLEPGAFPTSYIPTTTTSLTRNADVVSMTGANFSGWFNASQGSFASSVIIAQVASKSPGIYAADDGTTSNTFNAFYSTTALSSSRVAGNLIFSAASGALSASPTTINTAFAYADANYAGAYDGAALTTQLSGAIPSGLNRLQIGAYDGSYLSGQFRRLLYWPQRLTNAEILAFSKG